MGYYFKYPHRQSLRLTKATYPDLLKPWFIRRNWKDPPSSRGMPCCAVRTAVWERGEGVRQICLELPQSDWPTRLRFQVSRVTGTWEGEPIALSWESRLCTVFLSGESGTERAFVSSRPVRLALKPLGVAAWDPHPAWSITGQILSALLALVASNAFQVGLPIWSLLPPGNQFRVGWPPGAL